MSNQNQTQKSNVESVVDFLTRSQNDALNEIEFLKSIVSQQREGLGLADLGAKIAYQEGLLKAYTFAKIHVEKEDN